MHPPFSNVLLEPQEYRDPQIPDQKFLKSSPFIEKMPLIVKGRKNQNKTPQNSPPTAI